MLVITGKAAEMVEKFEESKKMFGIDKLPTPPLTDEQTFELYKLIDSLKTFPPIIDICTAVCMTASLKLTKGTTEELIEYVEKLRDISIK